VSDVVLFKRSDVAFEPYGEPSNKATIAKLIGEDLSGTMGGGLATFDGAPITWTVLYDEAIAGIAGEFRLGVGDRTYVMGPGDVIWIPRGTEVRYEGNEALVFYALYPVNWRTAGSTLPTATDSPKVS
jgi:ethanolamine utilization protein EutQ